MSPGIRKTLVAVILSVCWITLRAQTDSLALDSVTRRVVKILEVYNSYSIYVDTSEYISNAYDADDINLQTAASLGACNEIIRLYIRGADVNNFAGNTATPLHYAVNSGKWEAVEILLLLGADPNSKDMFGNTPLITAVRANYPESAEKLIRYGASLTERDRQNSSPLHHAAALGNFTMTDMLLYYDSPMEMFDSEGNTPLMAGVAFGYYDITDLLLQSGADPNAADKRGFTPLMAATQNGDTLMMDILVSAGANLYALNNNGIDALGCAIICDKKEAALFLLDRGSRWGVETGVKADPVSLAHTFGRKEMAEMMMEMGLKGQRELSFNQLSASAGLMLTSHYQLATASISVYDPGFHTGITIGAAFNPTRQRLLVEGNDDVLYQYRIKSNVIYAGLYREYPVSQPLNEIRVSFVPSLNMGYRFHTTYEGTDEKPESRLTLMPSADLRFSRRNLQLNTGLTWLKMPFYRTGPVWFTLRASYSLIRSTSNFTGKRIRLYNYEQN